MIVFDITGTRPRALRADLLPRIARECSRLKKAYSSKPWSVGIVFLSEARMRELNRIYRKKNRPTDVLSFSATEGGAFPDPKGAPKELGDVFVCPSCARASAREQGVDVGEELVRLVIHGVMHLMGYDHATTSEKRLMFGKQERIVQQLCSTV